METETLKPDILLVDLMLAGHRSIELVRTVALEATLQSVVVPGLLVLIRTFLSWALVVEIEGRWPWQGTVEAQEGWGEEARVRKR